MMKKFMVVASSLAATAVASGGAREKLNEIVDQLNAMADMSKADGKKERDLYATFKCWCDSNEKEKSAAIKANTALEAKMEAKITKLTGGTGSLSEATAKLKSDMGDNVEARNTKDEIHNKQMGEWGEEEQELTESISSLGQAIDTLSAVGADQTSSDVDSDHAQQMGQNSLLSQSSVTKLQKQLQVALESASSLRGKRVPLVSEKRLLALVESKAPFTGTYTSQSVEIMGMLRTMRDTFDENLNELKAGRTKALSEHTTFMQTKLQTYNDLKQSLEEKNTSLSGNDGDLTEAHSTLAVSKGELAADSTFLENMLASCAAKKSEYDGRVMLRTQEEAAISQAVAVLSSDEVFDLFGKESVASTDSAPAPAPANVFLQLSQASLKKKQQVLSNLLTSARITHSSRLARVAAMLSKESNATASSPVASAPAPADPLHYDVEQHQNVGPFAPLFAAIDGMISTIQDEAASDLKKKDWCSAERLENRNDRDGLEANIATYGNVTIPAVEGEITALTQQLDDDHVALDSNKESAKEATNARKTAHIVYNAAIVDAEAAANVLNKGIDILKSYYSKLPPAARPTSFLQKARRVAQDDTIMAPGRGNAPAPDTFDGAYEGRSTGGNSVVALLDELLRDVEEEANRDHDAEIEEQSSFETTMTDLTGARVALQKGIVESKKELAGKKEHLELVKESMAVNVQEHEAIVKYLASIKEACDFIKVNYEKREANRHTESESLKFAKSSLMNTPANKEAVYAHEQELLGSCKDVCEMEKKVTADCQACLNKVTVPAYCAGNPETPGC